MMYTYFNTTTSGTTPASVIGDGVRSIVVRKIIVGNPLAGTLTLFNIGNALANNTTQIAFLLTFPTFSTTNVNSQFPVQIDLRSNEAAGGSVGEDGLVFQSGGCISISAAMQVTVLWDYAEG